MYVSFDLYLLWDNRFSSDIAKLPLQACGFEEQLRYLPNVEKAKRANGLAVRQHIQSPIQEG